MLETSKFNFKNFLFGKLSQSLLFFAQWLKNNDNLEAKLNFSSISATLDLIIQINAVLLFELANKKIPFHFINFQITKFR